MTNSESGRYLVISADCHAGLPIQQYRDWLEPKYRDAFDAALPGELELRQFERDTFLEKGFQAEWETGRVPEGMRGAWDSEERNRQLDEDGVAGEVAMVYLRIHPRTRPLTFVAVYSIW